MMAAIRHEERTKKGSLATVKLDWLIFWTVILFQVLLSRGALAEPSGPMNSAMIESYGQLPLSFEQNRGQADPQVLFLARGAGYSWFLTPTETVLELTNAHRQLPMWKQRLVNRQSRIGSRQAAKLEMRLVGGNARANVTGLDELPGKVNYLVGSRGEWKTDIPTYAKVRVQDVYRGIDLVYY